MATLERRADIQADPNQDDDPAPMGLRDDDLAVGQATPNEASPPEVEGLEAAIGDLRQILESNDRHFESQIDDDGGVNGWSRADELARLGQMRRGFALWIGEVFEPSMKPFIDVFRQHGYFARVQIFSRALYGNVPWPTSVEFVAEGTDRRTALLRLTHSDMGAPVNLWVSSGGMAEDSFEGVTYRELNAERLAEALLRAARNQFAGANDEANLQALSDHLDDMRRRGVAPWG